MVLEFRREGEHKPRLRVKDQVPHRPHARGEPTAAARAERSAAPYCRAALDTLHGGALGEQCQ